MPGGSTGSSNGPCWWTRGRPDPQPDRHADTWRATRRPRASAPWRCCRDRRSASSSASAFSTSTSRSSPAGLFCGNGGVRMAEVFPAMDQGMDMHVGFTPDETRIGKHRIHLGEDGMTLATLSAGGSVGAHKDARQAIAAVATAMRPPQMTADPRYAAVQGRHTGDPTALFEREGGARTASAVACLAGTPCQPDDRQLAARAPPYGQSFTSEAKASK